MDMPSGHDSKLSAAQAAIEAEQPNVAAASAPDKGDMSSRADQVLADLLAASTEGRLAGRLYGEHQQIYRSLCAGRVKQAMGC